LKWANDFKLVVTKEIPQKILRACQLWNLSCQCIHHDLCKRAFNFGMALYNAWKIIIRASGPKKELQTVKRKDNKKV
jgi:hypothetical protein